MSQISDSFRHASESPDELPACFSVHRHACSLQLLHPGQEEKQGEALGHAKTHGGVCISAVWGPRGEGGQPAVWWGSGKRSLVWGWWGGCKGQGL